jgi:ubiquinone/menaquinone biosynthesis C-methylase UbiE
MENDPVRDYYDGFGEREWLRLENPSDGAIEYAVTRYMLAKYVPNNARVLDIGGGPGRYAIWLAQRGCHVVLADLSPELLSIARKKIAQAGIDTLVEEIVEANACDLSHWVDNSFDAVLSLGPFYHLPNPEDRIRAITELKRVLRPGGIAFVAFMPRYTFIRRILAIPDERHHLVDPEFVERVLEEGIFINDIPGRFTNGYGVRPEEVVPFFKKYGFKKLEILSTESIIPDVQRQLFDLTVIDQSTYDTILNIILRTVSEPSILGMAAHLLYIGEKG